MKGYIDKYNELFDLVVDFVIKQKKVWNMSDFTNFLKEQNKKFQMTEPINLYLTSLAESLSNMLYNTQLKEVKRFNELIGLAVKFVEKQNGMWRDSEWSKFLNDVQKKGVTFSSDITDALGLVTESMKLFYTEINPEKFNELFDIAYAFVEKQRGVWNEKEWLDFLTEVQDKGFELSDNMKDYIGSLLESIRILYNKVAIERFNTLIEYAGSFVEKQRGSWDDQAWAKFLDDIQKEDFIPSADMKNSLGRVLESMKVFYIDSLATTQSLQDNTMNILRHMSKFIVKTKGQWDHQAWLDFSREMQNSGIPMTKELEDNLGKILESTRDIYRDLYSMQVTAGSSLLKSFTKFFTQVVVTGGFPGEITTARS